MMVCRYMVVAALLSASCGKPAPAPVSGSPSARVVSLAPNLTEMIWAVGAGSTLVGRTSACDYPVETRSVPVVGGYGQPSLEMLVAAQPTCVVYVDVADKAFLARLRERGMEVRLIPCVRLDDIPEALDAIGAVTGFREQGARLAAALRADIAAARAARPGTVRPRVFVALWDDPLYTVGRGSFVSELIALAGGTNIGDAVDRPYFQASPEWVIRSNPEAIVCLFDGPPDRVTARIRDAPAFAALSAVRQRRVYAGFDVDLTLRPGPRVMQSVARLRDCLSNPHPPELP